MIKPVSAHKLAHYLQADVTGSDVAINRVSIDTRTLVPGDLYVAIVGKRLDGHDFILEAQEKGALVAIVERGFIRVPKLSLTIIEVADTIQALGQIAKYNRRNFHGKMITITGSNGKTTVKEMVKSICRSVYHERQICSTQGNLNNHIGVPLTLLDLKESHLVAVLELGASKMGDIAYTVRLAMPDIAVLTNASPAHIGEFGSMENIISAKSEIIEGLDRNGQAIINISGEYAEHWVKKAHPFNTTTVSDAKDDPEKTSSSHVKLTACIFDHKNNKLSIRLSTPLGELEIKLNYLGRHNANNAALACAVGLAMGFSLQDIKQGLERAIPFDSRLQIESKVTRCRLINDSYNANPSSVKSAIDVLSQYGPRSILVLGEMAELGHDSNKYHYEIGQYAKDRKINYLLALGSLNENTIKGFGENSHLFSSRESLVNHLLQLIDNNSTVLVKGSRSAKMERVVQLLIENP